MRKSCHYSGLWQSKAGAGRVQGHHSKIPSQKKEEKEEEKGRRESRKRKRSRKIRRKIRRRKRRRNSIG